MPVSAAEDVLTAALRGLVRELVAEELANVRRALVEFSQLEGQRPIGVKSTRYLRAWRRGRDAGDPECRADGRARLMTAAAWERWGASAPTRVTRYRGVTGNAPALLSVTGTSTPSRHVTPTSQDVTARDADVLAELGLDATRRAG